MKKYILIAVMALLPLAGFSQSVFDKFEDLDDVTTVIVNKSMFNLLAKMDIELRRWRHTMILVMITHLG